MKTKLLIVATVTLFSVQAMAARPMATNYADLYFVPSAEIENDPPVLSGQPDGDGYGIKAQFLVADNVALLGEYQTVKLEDNFGEFDFDTLRLGAGIGPGIANGAGLYGTAEYINAEFEYADEDDSGFALDVGYAFKPTTELRLYGQVGYVDISDSDGVEFLVGGAYQFTPLLGLFADYRSIQLENGDNEELELNDFRVGARIFF